MFALFFMFSCLAWDYLLKPFGTYMLAPDHTHVKTFLSEYLQLARFSLKFVQNTLSWRLSLWSTCDVRRLVGLLLGRVIL